MKQLFFPAIALAIILLSGASSRLDAHEASPLAQAIGPVNSADGPSGPTPQDCSEQTASIYSAAYAALNATRQSAAVLEAKLKAVLDVDGSRVVVIGLSGMPSPAYFVGYSCAVDATTFHAGFRVYAPDAAGYNVAAKSEDQNVLANTDRLGDKIDASTLEAESVSRNTLITTWTRAGGSPTTASIIGWSWDGHHFNAVLQQLELTAATADVAPPLIVIRVRRSDEEGRASNSVYRSTAAGSLEYIGPFEKSVIEPYFQQRLVASASPEELYKVAGLWQDLGDTSEALADYERALKADTSAANSRYYLVASDLYQQQGRFQEAATMLQGYLSKVGANMTSQGRSDVGSQLLQLQKRAEAKQ